MSNTIVHPALPDGGELTVLRANWGTSQIPEGKRDFLDRTEFVGGVARHVPRETAEKWAKVGRLGLHFLPDDADQTDFIRVTGRAPMEASEFAAMLRAYTPEQILEMLGEERTRELLAKVGVGAASEALKAKKQPR